MQTDTAHLISETVIAVFRANGRILEWGDSITTPFGLTSARWQVLGAIAWSTNKATAPKVAEQMGISRQGAQKQLNLLVDDGLVERLANPAHRRSPVYRLSPRGEALYKEVSAAWDAHAKAIAENFSGTDLEMALRVLNELADLHRQSVQGENDET